MTAVRAVSARSLMFVPGDRPDRFDKAVATGADAVVLDLEDAVPAGAKAEALAHVTEWLSRGNRAIVRVNGIGTASHADEVDALRGSRIPLMVPKSESAEELATLAARLGDTGQIIALIETARGVRDIDSICAVDGVVRLALGNADLSAELGTDAASHAALTYTRGRLVLASAAAGLPAPIDGVTLDFDSPDALERDLNHGKELGFTGKLCIHPRQVAIVNLFLSPSAGDIAWAERVLAQSGGADGVSALDGFMIDAPVVRRAEQILARSRSVD